MIITTLFMFYAITMTLLGMVAIYLIENNIVSAKDFSDYLKVEYSLSMTKEEIVNKLSFGTNIHFIALLGSILVLYILENTNYVL